MIPFNVLIRHLEIGGANALAGHGAIGYPSMTAFLGLAQVTARAVAGEMEGRFLRRFAIIHHTGRSRLYGIHRDKLTQKRYVHADAGPPSKTEHWQSPPEYIRPQIDLTFSLLLETKVSPERAATLKEEPGILDTCIGHRALGGTVRKHGAILSGADSFDLLARAKGGHVIVDLTPELFLGDGRDPLDVLLDRLSIFSDRASPDRLFMAHTGYLAVSEPALRTTARGEIPHQHAEPIFGLASFRRSFAIDAASPAFWTPVIDRNTQSFHVKGEPK
ncbi:MAG: hypothetical protein K2Q10_04810 [Rhodospirillales bacterium]|nr:hypothetical protein [Rhodospirillales bacterium]